MPCSYDSEAKNSLISISVRLFVNKARKRGFFSTYEGKTGASFSINLLSFVLCHAWDSWTLLRTISTTFRCKMRWLPLKKPEYLPHQGHKLKGSNMLLHFKNTSIINIKSILIHTELLTKHPKDILNLSFWSFYQPQIEIKYGFSERLFGGRTEKLCKRKKGRIGTRHQLKTCKTFEMLLR